MVTFKSITTISDLVIAVSTATNKAETARINNDYRVCLSQASPAERRHDINAAPRRTSV